MNREKELVGATTAALVLGVLAKAPSYGYEIVRRLNDEAGGLFVWQEGTLYPVLYKLEQQGKVRSQWQQADTGRERKYYYITADGRAALRAEAKQWQAFHALMLRVVGPAAGAAAGPVSARPAGAGGSNV